MASVSFYLSASVRESCLILALRSAPLCLDCIFPCLLRKPYFWAYWSREETETIRSSGDLASVSSSLTGYPEGVSCGTAKRSALLASASCMASFLTGV
jgi:hypothetical protein